MRNTILCTFVLLAAAACSPPASTTTSDGSAAPAQSAAATAPPGGGQIRLGRWNKTITVMGQQTHEVECVTTADLNTLQNEPGSSCTSANGFQRTPEGLVSEADCTGEDGGGHIRTVLTGDLQNNYSVHMTTSGGGVNMEIQIDGVYEGACRGDE